VDNGIGGDWDGERDGEKPLFQYKRIGVYWEESVMDTPQ